MTTQGSPNSAGPRPDYWPYDGKEHKLMIEAHIKLLLAIEQLEKRLWGEWWPCPPPPPVRHRRRKSILSSGGRRGRQ